MGFKEILRNIVTRFYDKNLEKKEVASLRDILSFGLPYSDHSGKLYMMKSKLAIPPDCTKIYVNAFIPSTLMLCGYLTPDGRRKILPEKFVGSKPLDLSDVVGLNFEQTIAVLVEDGRIFYNLGFIDWHPNPDELTQILTKKFGSPLGVFRSEETKRNR